MLIMLFLFFLYDIVLFKLEKIIINKNEKLRFIICNFYLCCDKIVFNCVNLVVYYYICIVK